MVPPATRIGRFVSGNEALLRSGDHTRLELPSVQPYNLDRLDLMKRRELVSWQLQEAKQRFSELVRRTLEEGPQVVTRHGEEVVVVVSAEEFRRTNGEKMDFKEFLLSGPDLSVLDLERPKELPRDVDL
jgi:prevent-host-death family protein